MLVDRLALIAPKIVSEQQRGFIKDMHIAECIASTLEAINVLDCKSFGGNVALSLTLKRPLIR